MYYPRRGTIRYLASAAAAIHKTSWDPTVSLTLNHPTLLLLEKCNSRYHFKQILAQMMRKNLTSQTFTMSRLLYFCAISHPENLDLAFLLYNHFTPSINLFIYNVMISASSAQAFALYNRMLRSFIYPDKHTLLYLLQASDGLYGGKQIHCHSIVMGMFSCGYLQNSLIKMYMENGQMGYARKVFEQMPEPDAVSFNVMIIEYSKRGCSSESIKVFREMMSSGLVPDGFTMLGLLMYCGQLGLAQFGKSIHAWIERRECLVSSSLILGNALLDMYVKCKELKLARAVFSSLRERDAFSWNTMIAGYAKIGELDLACRFFYEAPKRDPVSWNSMIAGYARKADFVTQRTLLNKMISEDVRPDEFTMVNLVSAAAEIASLGHGRWLHGLALRMQIKLDAILGSSLINMYSKCGHIEKAFKVFKGVAEKDVTVWTTMITGFAFHGHGSRALEMFFEMQKYVMPNHVTLLAVLTACSHSGFVDEGLKVFNTMRDKYAIEPGIEHYGCLVDLLARSGKLELAVHVIKNMPMRPSRSIWGSVLSACKAKEENTEMAKMASAELLRLEPEKEGGYVLLSNIYASCGKWLYSDDIREVMENQGIKKPAGCSSLVVDGVEHEFVAADKRHRRWADIQAILFRLRSQMKIRDEFSSE
ncbi:hypothetical protein Nepgr_009649 [Nepenthes gracilis]|uniref:Pentatricopeptide repeat-containing protein n=1 Tax=Nepenthes gracilis TaxID=150966 RepID=A0AAD3SBR2_NEPGR|nr:hypothetical protein Nepgr_009649 [Nepenthes gracilis]